jgi:hypothetical protein
LSFAVSLLGTTGSEFELAGLLEDATDINEALREIMHFNFESADHRPA